MAAKNRRSNKKTSYFPKALVNMSIDSNAVEGLQALEKLVQEKVLRSAAYAGAKVFYDEMRLRVPVDEGQLYGAIYHYHLEKKSDATHQFYAIGPNKKKAPHWYNVEYGHWRVNKVTFKNGRWYFSRERLPVPVWIPGKPYVRPTYDAKAQAALTAMKRRFGERLSEVMRELKP